MSLRPRDNQTNIHKRIFIMNLSKRDQQNWLHALTTQPQNPATGLIEWLLGPVKAFFHLVE